MLPCRTHTLPSRACESNAGYSPGALCHGACQFRTRIFHSFLHGYTLLLASRCAQVMIMTSSFSAFELRATSLVRSFSLRLKSYSRKTSLVRAKPRHRTCAIVSCVACLVVLLRAHHRCSPGCTRDRSRWSCVCPCAQYTSSRCQRSACRAARPAVSASGSRERASGGSGRRPLEGACSIWSSGGICGRPNARQPPPCGRRLLYELSCAWCSALVAVMSCL